MNIPKVSILVPVFNMKKYLVKCLSSLVNQTLHEIEIICINDGSTDSSLSIIQQFASSDNRIIIIDKPNTGYGDSMNIGLSIARGDYIGIVESDDFADSDMFEKLFQLTNNNSVDIVRSNYYEYWDFKGDANYFHADINHYESTIDLISTKELLLLPAAIWSAIYRRDFLLENEICFLPTPGASYQDTSFFIKTLFLAKRIVYTEGKFLHYRQDNESASVKQCTLNKAAYVNIEFQECDKFLKQKQIKNTEIMRFYNTKKLQTFLWNLYRVDDKKKYLELMKKDSIGILLNETYKKMYFSMAEKIILKYLKNNSFEAICLLLKLKKLKCLLLEW